MRINLSLAFLVSLLAVVPVGATDISGRITSTLTITENSKLVGNVSCPFNQICIQFGADNIKLNLNGYTIDGGTVCDQNITFPIYTNHLSTNKKQGVSIEGPGMIGSTGNFLSVGIVVNGNNSSVRGVTVVNTCGSGISINGSGNTVKGNTLVQTRFGIAITGIGNNVSNNEVVGAGPVFRVITVRTADGRLQTRARRGYFAYP